MSKITPLFRVISGFLSAVKYNTNADRLEAAFDNTLSRDGSEPNDMGANLDMGEHRIVNLAAPVDVNDAVRLQDILDLEAGEFTLDTAWDNITDKPSEFPPEDHIHAIADTTGLQAALDAKAASVHTHAQSDVTGLTSALAAKADTVHTHTTSDVTGFDEQVRDVMGTALVAGSNITITPNDGANTITIASSASGGGDMLKSENLSGLANYTTARSNLGLGTLATQNASAISLTGGGGTLSSRGQYSFGGVTGGQAFQWPFSYIRAGVDDALNNGEGFTIGGYMRATGGTVSHQKAALYGHALCSVSSDYVTPYLRDTVGILGQGVIETVADGRAWGGCFESGMVGGGTGTAKALEANVGNDNAGTTYTNTADNAYIVTNLCLGSGGTKPNTAGIWFNHSTNGWYRGIVIRDTHSAYVYCMEPQSGAIGLEGINDANWSDNFIIIPDGTGLKRYNSAGTVKNLIHGEDSTMTIGDGTANIVIDIPGLGQRTIQYGAADSAGAGFRTLRIAN